LLSVIIGIPLGIVASRGGLIGRNLASPVLCKRSLRLPCWHYLSLFRFRDQCAHCDCALFLYGLLPIVRNTASGLQDIPRSL
jgi:ABC-type proline/glycine betaine transport system permease subunit